MGIETIMTYGLIKQEQEAQAKMIDIHKPGYFSKHDIGDEVTSFYQENGFLVVHDAVAPEDIETLKNEAVAVCRHERGDLNIIQGEEKVVGDFPTAEDLRAMPDEEAIRHFLCIHQAHHASPVLFDFLKHPAIVDVLTHVIGPNVKCMQSMLFIKASGKPGQAWHQDEDFIPTRDRSLAGAWIAMDDAVIENGCLWVIPGSHKRGVLYPQYPHNDSNYDCTVMSYDFPYSDEDAVPVEVPAGSIVFFNGYLLHKSEPNTLEQGFRRVLVNHYMSAESLLPWRIEEGHGIAKWDFRDIIMIAGEDPYEYKGTRKVVEPHVRAAGQGGCGDGRVDLKTFKDKVQQGELSPN